MTHEQAIRVLQIIRKPNGTYDRLDSRQEALDMAIAALEAQQERSHAIEMLAWLELASPGFVERTKEGMLTIN